MKYNNIELEEMLSENWDGKTRQMLVWNGNDSCHLAYVVGYKHTHTTKHGFIEYDVEWLSSDGYYWQHCADIPNNESNEKFSIDYIIKILTERTQDEYWMPFDNCIVEYLKSLKELKVENEKLKDEVNDLKNSSSYQVYGEMCNEQNKLNEHIKSLLNDRVKMANEVSSAVWKEMMERAENLGPLICVQMPKGLGFNDISDIVLNKILDYTSEISEGEHKVETYPRWDFVENIMKTIPERKGSFTIPKRAVELMRDIEKACGICYEKNKKLKEENENLKNEVNELKNNVCKKI